MMRTVDVGDERDRLSNLDGLLRTDGWKQVEAVVRDRIDKTMQRIIQPDCSDRERAELIGEVRGLSYVADYPREEASVLLERLGT
jgi:hypothetical protein